MALAKVIQDYSVADIDALCHEAGMQSLRRGINSRGVSTEDFKKVKDMIGLNIPLEMENWYSDGFLSSLETYLRLRLFT